MLFNLSAAEQRPCRRDGAMILLFFSLFFGLFLGSRPLSSPDEGRYAEIPREMVVHGDYVTPHLNGVKYFEKPPLMYWLETVPIRVFGLGEWSLRLLPFTLGLMGVLGIYFLGCILIGRGGALMASGILGTSVLYYAHTRLLILDLGVTVFLSGSLLSFLCAVKGQGDRTQNGPRRGFLAGFFILMALAVLTKGLMALVIGGAVILLWTVPFRRFWALGRAFTPWGIGLFLLIAAPWHIAVSLKNPEFLWFYFVHEHFLRFLTTTHRRYQPIWFFVPILIVGFMPWVSLLIDSVVHGVRRGFLKGARAPSEDHTMDRSVLQFLLIAPGFILIFFSLSQSKLIPYILPAFPFLALVMGAYGVHKIREHGGAGRPERPMHWAPPTFRRVIWGGMIFGLLAVLGIGVIGFFDLYPLAPLMHLVYGLLALCVLLMVVPLALMAWGRWQAGLGVLVLLMGGIYGVLTLAWPVLEDRSIKPLALRVLKTHQDGDVIASYGRYYQDLPVYLNRRVLIVNWRGELDFGLRHHTGPQVMVDYGTFWDLWRQGQKNNRSSKVGRVCAIMRLETYQELKDVGKDTLFLYDVTRRDALVCNGPEVR